MALIAIDIDGVLADFIVTAVGVANGIWPGKLPPDYQPSEWNFKDKMTSADWSKVWAKIRATPNFWLTLPAYSESMVALARFFSCHVDMDVLLCTARTPTMGMTVVRQTELWFQACGVQVLQNSMNVIVAAGPNSKRQIYEGLGVEYSIDDKSETVLECQTLPNHKAALLTRPWNADSSPQWRVPSLQSFLDSIQ